MSAPGYNAVPGTPNTNPAPVTAEEAARQAAQRAAYIDGVIVAEPGGDLPDTGNAIEQFLHPEGQFSDTDNLTATVIDQRNTHDTKAANTTLLLIQALDAREFRSRPVRPAHLLRKRSNPKHPANLLRTRSHDLAGADPVGRPLSGIGAHSARRFFATIIEHAGGRSSVEHIDDIRRVALRRAGKMPGVDEHLIWVAQHDPRSAHFIEQHQPAQLGQRLGELSFTNHIPVESPLHARWAQALDPVNVRQLRRYLLETGSAMGLNRRTVEKEIDDVGFAPDRYIAMAAYFGVAPEALRSQLDPEQPGASMVVPPQVLVQVRYLIKLGGQNVRPAPGGAGGNVTALDEMISYGAGRPITVVPPAMQAIPGYDNPVQRLARLNQQGNVLSRTEHLASADPTPPNMAQARGNVASARQVAAAFVRTSNERRTELLNLRQELMALDPRDISRAGLIDTIELRVQQLDYLIARNTPTQQPDPRHQRQPGQHNTNPANVPPVNPRRKHGQAARDRLDRMRHQQQIRLQQEQAAQARRAADILAAAAMARAASEQNDPHSGQTAANTSSQTGDTTSRAQPVDAVEGSVVRTSSRRADGHWYDDRTGERTDHDEPEQSASDESQAEAIRPSEARQEEAAPEATAQSEDTPDEVASDANEEAELNQQAAGQGLRNGASASKRPDELDEENEDQ